MLLLLHYRMEYFHSSVTIQSEKQRGQNQLCGFVFFHRPLESVSSPHPWIWGPPPLPPRKRWMLTNPTMSSIPRAWPQALHPPGCSRAPSLRWGHSPRKCAWPWKLKTSAFSSTQTAQRRRAQQLHQREESLSRSISQGWMGPSIPRDSSELSPCWKTTSGCSVYIYYVRSECLSWYWFGCKHTLTASAMFVCLFLWGGGGGGACWQQLEKIDKLCEAGGKDCDSRT